jgi:glycerol-1-phosphate dehydrogenase [NAD(P)+]
MVVATAPSVDGYTSYGAAVSIKGFKQTLSCAAPLVVLADTDVLCEAPAEMIASGYGDCMAKFAAGMDWILADLLGVQAIRTDVWAMVQKPLRSVYAHHRGIANRQREGIGLLFDALSASGFAMQIMHDSRPASGAEHLISHIWEMEHLSKDGLLVSHGFKVAVGTMAIVHLYEELVELDVSDVRQKQPKLGGTKTAILSFFPNETVAQEAIAVPRQSSWKGRPWMRGAKSSWPCFPFSRSGSASNYPPQKNSGHPLSRSAVPYIQVISMQRSRI